MVSTDIGISCRLFKFKINILINTGFTMRFREFITEQDQTPMVFAQQTTSDVDQLVADIKKGEIAPVVVQAITNYIKKRLASQPPVDSAKPVSAPQPQPSTAPTQPVQPAATDVEKQPELSDPDSDEISNLKEAAMQLPAGVTLKPDDLRKFLLKGGFKSEEVNNIVTFAYRQTIQLTCEQIAAMKMYKKGAADILVSIFLNVPGTLSERNRIALVLTKTGVLNLSAFLKPHKGTFDNLLKPEYKGNAIVLNLKAALKNRSDLPTQVSAANKGAGEDLISILGNPVNKLSPGDLNIDGHEFEIKAMGARLKGFGGSNVYGDATRVYTEWATLVGQALGPTGQSVLAGNGVSLKKYLHFSLANLQALDDAMDASKVKNAGELIRRAFEILTETLYPMSDSKMRETILNSFDKKTGKFESEVLRKNWFLFSYDYYKLATADKKTGESMYAIMFFNQGTEEYQIVTDKKQIETNWDDYQLGTDLFNWTNPTGQAPKITLGKETRERRSRAKTKA